MTKIDSPTAVARSVGATTLTIAELIGPVDMKIKISAITIAVRYVPRCELETATNVAGAARSVAIPETQRYDCFDLRPPPCPGGMPMFHGECVGPTRETQEGRPFDSISSQMARNGDATRPVVMKMDVEGAEWDSFLLAPDSVFNHIDELDVEFHHVEDPKTVAVMQRLKQFFVLAHVHYNNFSCDPAMAPFPSWAFEVLLVNKRLATTDGSPAPHGPISLDAANNPQTPDCQAQ